MSVDVRGSYIIGFQIPEKAGVGSELTIPCAQSVLVSLGNSLDVGIGVQSPTSLELCGVYVDIAVVISRNFFATGRPQIFLQKHD